MAGAVRIESAPTNLRGLAAARAAVESGRSAAGAAAALASAADDLGTAAAALADRAGVRATPLSAVPYASEAIDLDDADAFLGALDDFVSAANAAGSEARAGVDLTALEDFGVTEEAGRLVLDETDFRRALRSNRTSVTEIRDDLRAVATAATDTVAAASSRAAEASTAADLAASEASRRGAALGASAQVAVDAAALESLRSLAYRSFGVGGALSGLA